MSDGKTLSDLRDSLFNQLKKLETADDPKIEIERAQAMTKVAGQIVNAAKLQLQAITTVGQTDLPDFADPKGTAKFFVEPKKGLSTGKELGNGANHSLKRPA